ncbi:MAG: hypothetical protein Q8O15_08005 [Rectinemataceae bacterium]|nr:hypothetical protein [Rectinemataceae bacterium]
MVEKSFLRTKNSLGFLPATDGTMLVAFIALILNGHIHRIMQEKKPVPRHEYD